jgi:hypothetical protein
MPTTETKSPEITRAAERYLEQYGDPHHRLDALRRRVVAGRKTGHLFEFKAEPIG